MGIDIDLNIEFTCSELEGIQAPSIENNSNAENVVHICMDDAVNNKPPIDLNQPSCVDVEDEAYETTLSLHMNEDEPECEEGEDFIQEPLIDLEEYGEHSVEQDPPYEEDEDVSFDGEPSFRRRGFLTNEQRRAICHLLLHSSHEGKLERGTISRASSLYDVDKSIIHRIWKQVKENGDASHRRTRNCGRKRIQLDSERVREIPLKKRQTLRSLASALDINKTSLIRLVKGGIIRRCSNSIKPHLKEGNKIARLRFCFSMFEESSIPHDPKFKSMHNVIHIDEKWFYLTKRSMNCYLLPDEAEPHRTCKNKNFIEKLMFLVAVARPRFDDEGNETFSGKIGVFPLVYEQEAKRTSANRVAGTLEKKPITSVTKEICKKWLIDKVLPTIKEKWPMEDLGKTIFIQQDNARCHVRVDDEDFCQAASEGGFDIRLFCQPPNSPDLNVLDLGFFRAIQSLQEKEAANSIDNLIEAVEKSFEAFSVKNSNKIFLTLQANMIEIMKSKGSNNHKLPHLRKDVVYKDGLPNQLICDASLVEEVFNYLQDVE